jgi:uroporphyrin-III C-methyltransferase
MILVPPSQLQQGCCILVGAGPGDPELLTIKAVKAIAQATLVLVDDLVNPEILTHASPKARVIHVGKRGGCISTPQSFIHKLMIQAVKEGEQVVRLKGGDPFTFGRGGEEIEALNAAGIEVSVINGITSGLAAVTQMGCPLTHRQHAQGVMLVTGHQKTGAEACDWVEMGQAAMTSCMTLVIYMGAGSVTAIQAGLLQRMPADMPVCIVQNATLAQEKSLVTDLGHMVQDMRDANLGSPCIIAVGKVLAKARSAIEQELKAHPSDVLCPAKAIG